MNDTEILAYTDSRITELEKENEKLSKMLEIVLPKALEHENHIFYEHKRTLEQYRAELEKRVEEHKNDNNCPDVMCDDCNKECDFKKIMGETK